MPMTSSSGYKSMDIGVRAIDPEARTYDEITAGWVEHYGIKLADVGEAIDIVILGHHDTRRVVAALNRHARRCWGEDSIAKLGAVPGNLTQRWARFVTESETAPRLEPWGPWRIDWTAQAGNPDAFPITLWRARADSEPAPVLSISLPAPKPVGPTAPVIQADVDALIEAMQPGRYFMTVLYKGYADAVRAAGRVPASRIALGMALGRDPRVAGSRTGTGRVWQLV